MESVFNIAPAPAKALWFLGIICCLLAALLALFIYLIIAARGSYTFTLSDSELQIANGPHGRTIPYSQLDLQHAGVIDLNTRPEYRPKWKTGGTSLPGFHAGWFKLKNGSKSLVFVTERDNVVYLPTTEGFSILLSVDEAENFLRELRDRVQP